MTFADLFETLTTRGVLPRAKDCKSALRLLAQALGFPNWDECPVEHACQQESTWGKELERHFAHLQTTGRTLSGPHRRNIRSNLRKVFEVADQCGLLTVTLPPLLLTKLSRDAFHAQQYATSPYKATYQPQRGPHGRYGLPLAQWPADIQANWRAYQAQCGLRLRERTLRTQTERLTVYLGYLTNICGRTPTWEDVFDVEAVREFVLWHGKRLGRSIASSGFDVVATIAAVARTLKHSQARALADFRNALPTPAPMHIKRHHMVPLATLEAVAEDCLTAGRVSYETKSFMRYPGARRASAFQRGVMLKLLTRVPLRQRNVREMRLGDHLYQDHDGAWQLSFAGDDLKIGTRGGRVNTYELNLSTYCPEFFPILEEFLRVYRPRLPGAAASTHVFLTQNGTPYTAHTLGVELSDAVAMRTGKRFYPHLIRTIWATEYIEKTRDFTGAAYLLGDNVATVLRAYQDILGKDQHAKAKDFLAEALKG